MYVLECYDIGVPGGCEPPKGAKESTLRLPWLVKRGTVEVSLGYRRSVNVVSLYSHAPLYPAPASWALQLGPAAHPQHVHPWRGGRPTVHGDNLKQQRRGVAWRKAYQVPKQALFCGIQMRWQ